MLNWQYDQEAEYRVIRQEGHSAGIKEGIEQTKIEMVKNFMMLGTPINVIAQASGFSLEEIKKLS